MSYEKELLKLKPIFNLLEENGKECYLVGGCVRDLIIGKDPHDFDITTNATPEEMISIFKSNKAKKMGVAAVILTGIKYGTVTIVLNTEPYEVTTYRTDGEYVDGRHPDEVQFTKSLVEDLSRRDFTMNAIAMDYNGNFIDPFNGKNDLTNKILRCVGNPFDRFEEDNLRIIRGFRFAYLNDLIIEENTYQAMTFLISKITACSGERIQAEIKKLSIKKPIGDITILEPMLFELFPELLPMKDCLQNNPHHQFDVWNHTKMALSLCEESKLFMPILFHDSGKPFTKSTDENGIDHFYEHNIRSCKIIEPVLERLKYSNKEKKYILDLILEHDIFFNLQDVSKKSIKKFMMKYNDPGYAYQLLEDLFTMKYCDLYGQVHVLNNTDRLAESLYARNKALTLAKDIIDTSSVLSTKDLQINGHDIMKITGQKGVVIGELLNKCLQAVLDESISNSKKDLLNFIRKETMIKE